MKAVVDRIESETAVLLIGKEERQLHVPLEDLPPGTRESSILRITFHLDLAETEKTLDAMRSRIERLKNK